MNIFSMKRKKKPQQKRMNRRPRRGRNKKLNKTINILNCNANGLKNKLSSLEKVVLYLNPSIWAIQETHMQKAGKIKFPNSSKYQIYELVRTEKKGGGLALGVEKELNPSWVR